MFAVMLRLQRTFNRWFERFILEDRYRYLARRGHFESAFETKLTKFRQERRYGAVRLAYAEAKYEQMRELAHQSGEKRAP